MKLVQFDWNPSTRQLRQFGAAAVIGLPLVGWLLVGRTWPAEWSERQLILMFDLSLAGMVCGIAAVLRPGWLKPLFIVLSLVTFPIGLVVSELLLLLIFYGIFTPVGLLFRLIGRDALQRSIEPQSASYWTPMPAAKGVESYFRQS